MTKAELRGFTSWLGKRSYKVRVERLGIERIREIARENGKKGGPAEGKRREEETREGRNLRWLFGNEKKPGGRT